MSTKTTGSGPVRRIYEDCRARRDEHGAAAIASKDVATLIRAHLRREFPGVKFRVTTRGYSSVSISWTDGPHGRQVDAVCDRYSFGGFDGMIDMEYQGCNWLHPDGTMSHAGTQGTEGQRGCVESSGTDCPEPGAVLVKYGPKYVHAQRVLSDGKRRELLRGASEYYGFPYDPDGTVTGLELCSQRHAGEWVTTLMHRWDQDNAAHD